MVEINFEKLKLEIQSLDQTYNENIKNLNNMLSEFHKQILTETKKRDEEANIQQKLENEINELEMLKSKLQDEEARFKEAVHQLNSDNIELTSKLSELGTEKLKLENQVNEKNTIAKTLANNIANIETKISNEDAKITHAQNDSMVQIDQLETEITHVRELLAIQNNYSKILKSLLKDNYISLPHFDVCKVLTQPGVTSLDRLIMSSGVDKNTVSETLRELSVRGVLDFNQGTGEFSIIKSFEL